VAKNSIDWAFGGNTLSIDRCAHDAPENKRYNRNITQSDRTH
jgi:hypothetical protein